MPLIRAALEHQGAASIDCMSPSVAFNNHAGCSKSFGYVREHNEAVNYLDMITGRDEIVVDYAPGSIEIVKQHDCSRLRLPKLDGHFEITSRGDGEEECCPGSTALENSMWV